MIWKGYMKSLKRHRFIGLPFRILPPAVYARKPVFHDVYSAVNLN